VSLKNDEKHGVRWWCLSDKKRHGGRDVRSWIGRIAAVIDCDGIPIRATDEQRICIGHRCAHGSVISTEKLKVPALGGSAGNRDLIAGQRPAIKSQPIGNVPPTIIQRLVCGGPTATSPPEAVILPEYGTLMVPDAGERGPRQTARCAAWAQAKFPPEYPRPTDLCR